MSLVQSLIENARRILDTAVEAKQSGQNASDWTFFVGPEGGLEIIAGAETPLDSLTWSRGASMAWQLRPHSARLRTPLSVRRRGLNRTSPQLNQKRRRLSLNRIGPAAQPEASPPRPYAILRMSRRV